jgi:hypothetical protein
VSSYRARFRFSAKAIEDGQQASMFLVDALACKLDASQSQDAQAFPPEVLPRQAPQLGK